MCFCSQNKMQCMNEKSQRSMRLALWVPAATSDQGWDVFILVDFSPGPVPDP